MMRRAPRYFIGVLVLLWIVSPASALDPNARISQYRHTAWRIQEGAFASAPNAIAQTPDGYLWIGTSSGLVKYDGVRFIPWSPPTPESLASASVYSLRVSSDGTLWIGTSAGLLSWKDGRVHEHLPGRVNSIVEDRKGGIWVARSRVPTLNAGLCQVLGERPQCIAGNDQMRLPYAEALSLDPQGNLWIGGAGQLVRWRDGSYKTYLNKELGPSRGLGGISSIAVAGDGAVWVAFAAKGLGLFRIAHDVVEKIVPSGLTHAHAITLFVDREGSLWIGTSDSGVYRLYDGRIDHFRSPNGLSSDQVNDFFEDREGNLWLATSRGLDRFVDNSVVTFSTSEGLSADRVESVLATDDGAIWIGNQGNLDVLRGRNVNSIRIPGKRVTSLWQDHAKRLWVGIDDILTIYDRGRFTRINRPDGSPLGALAAITEDRDQNVWASVVGRDQKLFRVRDLLAEDFPVVPSPRHLEADPTGGIWMVSSGNLDHYRNGKLEAIPLRGSNRMVRGLTADADGSVWASTSHGLSHWVNGRMETLTSGNGLPCDGIFSAIRDKNAVLWLYSECGLIGIADSELTQWSQQPNRTIKFQILDVFGGAMPGPSTFKPAVSKSPDGRLWFANDSALQMIDPRGLRKNGVAPPVHVEEIHADRKKYAISGLIDLPPRSRDIEIGYTALSFSIPEKIQFRYKLDGRDQKWLDAGTRREVFYTDLDPGQYRFHVVASNNDGVWSEAGDSFTFAIAPAYHQTRWFQVSCLAVFLGILWAVHRYRLHQIAWQFRMQLETRVGERTRIARDLHDTLLQSFQGLLLRFQVVDESLPPGKAKEELGRALDLAARAITEGRDTVQGLRSTTFETNDLVRAIGALGQELAANPTNLNHAECSIEVEGGPRDLQPMLRDEIYRIAGEALRNAFRHARAQRIEVAVGFGEREFQLRVRDNGQGIDQEVLHRQARAGHFGLPGMRERAELIGGSLEVSSRYHAGTEVELNIPAAIAYVGSPIGSRSSLLSRMLFAKKTGTKS